ncbi:hypothetical protein R20233_00251 [Ralstonia sp. LMG 32965]|uniref:hypothetical protein n=1 Tax=Ralstonia TaxID=48736 RepID=UPI000684A5AA|nr:MULTISPECIES: hypothetical protein [unclassified Ralstonia]CAJ0854751.1 hypothetical protein R20233_00251 [Ralstonia sp. LMG 32965]
MRPEDVLPDTASHADFDGLTIRKGTVAAFLANAQAWLNPDIDCAQRAEAAQLMREAVPALDALGVFAILEVRDAALRALITRWQTECPARGVQEGRNA